MYDEVVKRSLDKQAEALSNGKMYFTHAEAQQWEKLDRSLLKICLRAERKCRKLQHNKEILVPRTKEGFRAAGGHEILQTRR
jgi:hypothetical protein